MAKPAFDAVEVRSKLEKVLATKENFIKSATASFKQFDKDHNNSLDFEETKKLIGRLCLNLQLPAVDDESLSSIFHRFDLEGNGTLQFNEFTDMYYHMLCRIRDKFYPPKELRFKKHQFIKRHHVKGQNDVKKAFDFVKELGKGSFGEVWLVKEKSTGVERVCKTICKDKSAVPLEQIEEEIRIMKTLDHPNVIKIFEVFDDHHNVYLIMEYLRGGDLLSHIMECDKEKKKIPERFVLRVMRQCMMSLAYIHKERVIHKDLKPENIILLDQTDDAPAKLIDFGLAEMFGGTKDVTNNAAGTALYMAPEVFKHKLSFKCDVWSAGVILYILLTGRLPFFGQNLDEIKERITNTPVPFDRDCKGVSELALDILKKMLEKDQARRPTAAQCLEHPWFKSHEHIDREGTVATISEDLANNLKGFMKNTALRNGLVNLLANQVSLDTKKLRAIQEQFLSLDKDNSGSLSSMELSDALLKAGMPQWDITRILQAMDADDDHRITFTEFVAATYSWQDSELNAVWGEFQKMDLDGDGVITVDEFLQVLVGEDAKQKLISKSDIQDMLKQVDTNGDGKIEWQEFVAFVRGVKN